jgi:membrane associated rhomboid family serine protease
MFPIQIAVPTRYPALVTYALIAINCLVFLFQISLPPNAQEAFVSQFGLIPARYLGSFPYSGTSEGLIAYLPFLSNMFLHGGWPHLILNMWTLWLFGPAIEDRLGSARYLFFYLVCGLLASFTHAVLNLTSAIPAIGASGAISGVLGSFILLFPLARLVIMIPILFFPFFFEVPALFFAGFWFLSQLMAGTVELFAPSGSGGIAWWAHIGGFVAGIALTPVLHRSQQRYRAYYADEGALGFNPAGR